MNQLCKYIEFKLELNLKRYIRKYQYMKRSIKNQIILRKTYCYKNNYNG